MATHRAGYSVERTACIALMRDPRVMGIIAGTYHGTLAAIGIDSTYEEACEQARTIRDDLTLTPDIIDGEHQSGRDA